jgi:hypothetical protein
MSLFWNEESMLKGVGLEKKLEKTHKGLLRYRGTEVRILGQKKMTMNPCLKQS